MKRTFQFIMLLLLLNICSFTVASLALSDVITANENYKITIDGNRIQKQQGESVFTFDIDEVQSVITLVDEKNAKTGKKSKPAIRFVLQRHRSDSGRVIRATSVQPDDFINTIVFSEGKGQYIRTNGDLTIISQLSIVAKKEPKEIIPERPKTIQQREVEEVVAEEEVIEEEWVEEEETTETDQNQYIGESHEVNTSILKAIFEGSHMSGKDFAEEQSVKEETDEKEEESIPLSRSIVSREGSGFRVVRIYENFGMVLNIGDTISEVYFPASNGKSDINRYVYEGYKNNKVRVSYWQNGQMQKTYDVDPNVDFEKGAFSLQFDQTQIDVRVNFSVDKNKRLIVTPLS